MKGIFKILIIVIFLASCSNKQAENRNRSFIENKSSQTMTDTNRSELIEPFFYKQYVDSIRDTSKFELIETHDILVNAIKYTVNIYMIPNWGDPGDYLRIKVFENEKLLLDKFNINGWVKFNYNNDVPSEILSKNLIDSDKLLLLKINNKQYLFLFGWVYASEPGLMTVISLVKVPHIIINKEFEFHSLSDINKDNCIDLVGTTNFENKVMIDLNNLSLNKI
jgi:hypothetical protein